MLVRDAEARRKQLMCASIVARGIALGPGQSMLTSCWFSGLCRCSSHRSQQCECEIASRSLPLPASPAAMVPQCRSEADAQLPRRGWSAAVAGPRPPKPTGVVAIGDRGTQQGIVDQREFLAECVFGALLRRPACRTAGSFIGGIVADRVAIDISAIVVERRSPLPSLIERLLTRYAVSSPGFGNRSSWTVLCHRRRCRRTVVVPIERISLLCVEIADEQIKCR